MALSGELAGVGETGVLTHPWAKAFVIKYEFGRYRTPQGVAEPSNRCLQLSTLWVPAHIMFCCTSEVPK